MIGDEAETSSDISGLKNVRQAIAIAGNEASEELNTVPP